MFNYTINIPERILCAHGNAVFVFGFKSHSFVILCSCFKQWVSKARRGHIYVICVCVFIYMYIHIQGIHKRMVRFQKLTRNLFLTLHGHNAHRQQRQLSNSLLALATDLRGLPRNASRTISMLSSDTRGRPELLPLHKHAIFLKPSVPPSYVIPACCV